MYETNVWSAKQIVHEVADNSEIDPGTCFVALDAYENTRAELAKVNAKLEIAVEAMEQAIRRNQNGTPWFTKYQTIDICDDALAKINEME
jgi:hypothetical protein